MGKLKRTLVIHPEDKSTDFLCPIYETVKNKTVIRGGVSKDELIYLIKNHDRIMMMGHGSPYGLFAIGDWKRGIKKSAYDVFEETEIFGYVIDITMVKHLQGKECVFIWCNADQFVKYHNLSGFYSGMFVSEVSEAYFCSIKNPNKSMVEVSNNTFSEIMSKHINKPQKTLYKKVRQEYGILAESNPIALYNNERLYLN